MPQNDDCLGEFNEYFDISRPVFYIDSYVFTEGDHTVRLKPDYDNENNLIIEIINNNNKEPENNTVSGNLRTLRNHRDFDNADIPDRLSFPKYYDQYMPDSPDDIYLKIANVILKNGIENCMTIFGARVDPDYSEEKIAKALYGKGMISDPHVIAQVQKLKGKYNTDGIVPNLRITGQAGSGKTTLVKNLAGIFGKGVLSVTPSDLRGAYIGHTKYATVRKLAEAAKNNQVLFVGEVYQLMDDKFGHEAVTVLLPLMSGD